MNEFSKHRLNQSFPRLGSPNFGTPIDALGSDIVVTGTRPINNRWLDASMLMLGWFTGSGYSNFRFVQCAAPAQDMATAPGVNEARSRASRGGDGYYKAEVDFGSLENPGQAVDAVAAAGFSPTQQIVGGFQGGVTRSGNVLHFKITNQMSFKSFSSYVFPKGGPSWNRNSSGGFLGLPGGNVNHTFEWKETVSGGSGC